MAETRKSCILLSTDSAVTLDIRASLKLLEIDVLDLAEVHAVRESVEKERPFLIFARSELSESGNAAVNLARDLKSDEALQTIPIVLLHEKDEPSYTKTDFFDDHLIIPVEFPTFTQQARELFERFEKQPLEKREYRFSTVIEVPEGGSAKEQRESYESGLESPVLQSGQAVKTLDKRLVVASAIQLFVMDKIRGDTRFQSSTLADIPGVISEITEEVCQELDVKQLLGM